MLLSAQLALAGTVLVGTVLAGTTAHSVTADSCTATAESSLSAADRGGSEVTTIAGSGYQRRGVRVASGPATTFR